MKQILFTLTLIFLSTTISNSAENPCLGLKKLSKDFIACKAGNIKNALTKKKKKSSSTSDASSNTKNVGEEAKKNAKKVGEGAKKVGKSIKNTGSRISKFLSGFGPKNKD